MKALAVLVVLAGCDSVFGLERDEQTGCPHLPPMTSSDTDQDGVPAACDPDDLVGGTETAYFTFDGPLDPFTVLGTVDSSVPGEVTLGKRDNESFLIVRGISTATATIDVGYEIVATGIEAGDAVPWSELGVHAAARDVADSGQRGDLCYYGIDKDSVYLESHEDDTQIAHEKNGGVVAGTRGRFRLVRTPKLVSCEVTREGLATLATSFEPAKLAEIPGSIAISTDAIAVKLTYVFVAYQPTTRP